VQRSLGRPEGQKLIVCEPDDRVLPTAKTRLLDGDHENDEARVFQSAFLEGGIVLGPTERISSSRAAGPDSCTIWQPAAG
jgi:hypothetical protein